MLHFSSYILSNAPLYIPIPYKSTIQTPKMHRHLRTGVRLSTIFQSFSSAFRQLYKNQRKLSQGLRESITLKNNLRIISSKNLLIIFGKIEKKSKNAKFKLNRPNMFDRGRIGKQFRRSLDNSFEELLDGMQTTTAAAATGPIAGHYRIIQLLFSLQTINTSFLCLIFSVQ